MPLSNDVFLLIDELGKSRRIALFLDLDGTLIDIAPGPNEVVVPAGLVDLLTALRDALDGALAIVTGRRVADIDRLLAPARFVVAGLHGVEYRIDPAGPVSTVAADVPPVLLDEIGRLARIFPGVSVESKGGSVSLHWRGLDRFDVPLGVALADLTGIDDAGFSVKRGRAVHEIVPKHVSKGVAVERLLRLPGFAGRRPIMIGDDRSDGDAFEAVHRAGGLGLRVQSEIWPAETASFTSPGQVREWLSRLLEEFSR